MARIPKNHDWIKLYHKEWLTKLSIRSCDAATRGIYSDLKSLSALSEEEGVIFASDKDICKQLAYKSSQYNRAINQLIKVKLCVRGKNDELILTEMASVEYQLSAEKVPMSAQSELNESQLEPIERPTSKENGTLPPKIDAPIIDKNREDIEKKVRNPPTPQPTRSAGEVIPIRTHNHFLNQILSLLMDHTNLSEQDCRERVEQWLAKTGNAQVVIDLVKAGIGKGNPISYISKCVENEAKKRISNPPELEKPASQFELFKQQHADDPMFQKLSGEEQHIAFMILKETNDWMLKYYKDHNLSSWKFVQYIKQNQEKVA